MRATRPHLDRRRRTETVIETLRRRAELRRARGEQVLPALRHAIEEYDRHSRPRPTGRR